MRSKTKINATVIVIFCVISGFFFIGKTGFTLLSGLRAYVGGEGLWSKGQKEAGYHLTQYIFTKEESRYQSFLDSLKPPLGDRAARLELEKTVPDETIVFQGFLDGGNHAKDIPAMIALYQRFKDIEQIGKAVEQWEAGDELIQELLKIGAEVHHSIVNNTMGKERAVQILDVIDGLQNRFNEAENLFSLYMSEAARWTADLLFRAMLAFTVVGSIICFIMLRLIAGVIADLNDKNKQLAIQADRERAIKQDLAAEKERLAVTLESIGDGVITTDILGNIVLMNKVAEKLTGWSNEAAAGQPLDRVFHIIDGRTGEPCDNPAATVITTGRILGLASHTLLVTRGGEKLSIADSGAPILDDQGKSIGVVLVFRDITEQNKMEKELLKIEKLESIGILAGGIAHDFNNILAAILGNINLALLGEELKEGTKRNLIQAEKASIRAKDLTGQLLTFAKGGEPIKETFSLESVIRESAGFVLHGDTIDCSYYIPEDLWLVDIDKGQISQVIQNIVLNARQAMSEGGSIKIRCDNIDSGSRDVLPFFKDERYVKIAIQDSGIGMPSTVIKKIFDPYFSTKQEGSGLGLAITQSIINKHDGHIIVESSPGFGSIFTIYLMASKMGVAEEQVSLISYDSPCQIDILLMDDDEMLRNVAKAMLEELGHRVVLAADGEEAFSLYQTSMNNDKPFELVIMDLTIPGGLGGKETVGKILHIHSDAKVIVSSGYSNDPIMANFRDYGFSSALVKPYTLEELSRVIGKLMD